MTYRVTCKMIHVVSLSRGPQKEILHVTDIQFKSKGRTTPDFEWTKIRQTSLNDLYNF